MNMVLKHAIRQDVVFYILVIVNTEGRPFIINLKQTTVSMFSVMKEYVTQWFY